MPWSFRKSSGSGPLRLNLSKRGLGASVGVKGARVGVDSQGQATRPADAVASMSGSGSRARLVVVARRGRRRRRAGAAVPAVEHDEEGAPRAPAGS
jgi:hypothetical protein